MLILRIKSSNDMYLSTLVEVFDWSLQKKYCWL